MAITAIAFIEISIAAFAYSVVMLGFISLHFAIINTTAAWVLSAPAVYFGAYRTALAKAAVQGRVEHTTITY